MQTIRIHDVTVLLSPIPEGEPGSRRRLEKEAVLDIIRRGIGEAAELLHDPSGAPRLQGPDVPPGLHISISHCARTAVVALRENAVVGVDIEMWRDQLLKVAPRFLSPVEQQFFSSRSALLKAWTSKESAFKAAGAPDLVIADISLNPDLSRALIPGDKAANYHTFRLFHHPGPDDACLTIAIPDE